MRQRFGVFERRACKLTGQPRSTQRQVPKPKENVDAKIIDILRKFALANSRQGYRKAYRAVLEAGYQVNLKKVHRLWREAGLKVPFRKRKNRRAGHGVAMGAHHPIDANVTWAMDFQFDATTDGKILKLLNIIDEYSREYLATLVDRSIDAEGVISGLDGIVAERGTPVYIRMDNGPEFISHALSNWAKEMSVILYFIDPGSPWQNGKCESFGSSCGGPYHLPIQDHRDRYRVLPIEVSYQCNLNHWNTPRVRDR